MGVGRLTIKGEIGGIEIAQTIEKTEELPVPAQFTLPGGGAGELTSRTDNDTGVVTLEAGHPVVSGAVDAAWTGGVRRGMTATVSENECSLDGGAGDNLPALATDMVVTNQVALNLAFQAAADLKMLVMEADHRASVDFRTAADASAGAFDLAANEPYPYHSGMGTAPITDDVATVNAAALTTEDTVLKILAMVSLQ